MGKRTEGDYFLIKETGDIIKYHGRICEDYHKAKFDDLYYPVKLQTNSRFADRQSLYWNDDLWELTLIQVDPNSPAIPVLYGSR
jgi:hypothetical protein